MTRNSFTILAIVAAAAGGIVMNQLFAQEAAAPRPVARATSVAVCDLIDIFAKCEQGRQLTLMHQKRNAEVDAQEKAGQQKLIDKELVLDTIKRGTPEYEDKLQSIQKEYMAFEVQYKFLRRQMNRDYHMGVQAAYKDLTDMAATVAKERGIDIVLYGHNRPLAGRTFQELTQRMEAREVIYADKSLDLTEEVRKRFAAAFAASEKSD